MNYYPRNGFNNGFGNQQDQRQYPDNAGKAWRNQKMTKPNSPPFTGLIKVNGVDYFVSIWFGHNPKKGEEISIKVNPKQDTRRQQYQNSPGYGYPPPPPPQTYTFAPNNQRQQPQQPYNPGPQHGHNPAHGYTPPPPQPAGNVPPPPNGPADYGMEGYTESEDDFPGF